MRHLQNTIGMCIIAGVLAAVLTLTVTGCNRLTRGRVVERRHQPAYTTTTFVLSGKVLVPVTSCHPETWSVLVEGTYEGQVRLEWHNVRRDQYDALTVGCQWAQQP